MDTGQPVPESVSVALGCGIRSLQVIHTDLKGYFQFTLGGGHSKQYRTSAPATMSPCHSRLVAACNPPTGSLANSAIPKAC